MKRYLSSLSKMVLICSFLSIFLYSKAIVHADDNSISYENAVEIESAEEMINLLLETREDHNESVIVHVNTNKVQIESEISGSVDLHSSIYNNFHYGYVGGLSTSMDYDVYSGPSIDSTATLVDSDNSGYTYYKIDFEYHDNEDELDLADEKISDLIEDSDIEDSGELVSEFLGWMKANLPEEKMSSTGYPRNCNGIYGALFGDGTCFNCSTYALLIQRFCELAEIDSYILDGAYMEGEPCHAINVIDIDGSWYIVDYLYDARLIGTKNYNSGMKDIFPKYLTEFELSEEDLDAELQDAIYTIAFNGNGASSGKMASLKELEYGVFYKLTKNAFTKKGYTFAGWSKSKKGAGAIYKDKATVKNLCSEDDETVTLYAQWKPVNYKISYKLNKGKNSVKNPANYNITTKTITLAKPTRKGYTFSGWYSDKYLTKKVTKIKKGTTGNITLYAKWKKR